MPKLEELEERKCPYCGKLVLIDPPDETGRWTAHHEAPVCTAWNALMLSMQPDRISVNVLNKEKG